MADTKVGGVYIEIQARMGSLEKDLRGLQDKLHRTENSASGLNSTLKKVAGGIAFSAMMYKVVGALKESVKYASDLQETQNKFDVVFKNSSAKAQEYAQVLVDSYGMATREAMAFLSGTGDILTGMGMQADAALELSNATAQLGTDLASFSNVEGGAERAIQAITSAMTGEREALKAYGIVVSEEMVMEELRMQGKDKLTGMSLVQAKAEATLAIAYRQSGNAIGDMARSYDSYANIQRRVNSRMEDMYASVGEDLLPALSNLGLAFLSASKDGGFLSSAVHSITKFIGHFINQISLLMAKMQFEEATEQLEEMNEAYEDASADVEKYGKKLDDSLQTHEQVVAAAKAGNKEAQDFLKAQERQAEEYEKIEHLDDNRNKSYAEWVKISENIKNQDDILATNKEEIAKREAERAKEKVQNEEKITAEKKKQLEQQKKDIEEYGSLEVAAMYQKFDKFKNAYEKYAGFITGFSGQINELASMYASNQTTHIEQEAQKRTDALNAEYENQIALIEASAASDSQKAEQKKALDEQLARDTKAINDKAEKDKRKAQRESAKISKTLATFDTLINTPAAALQSFRAIVMPNMPWTLPLGIAAAAATTALGLAKLKLIQDQPLPALAEGGIVPAIPGGRQITVAEGGNSEGVIPFNDRGVDILAQAMEKAISKIGGGSGATNVYIDSELIYSNMYEASRRGAVKIDQRAIV